MLMAGDIRLVQSFDGFHNLLKLLLAYETFAGQSALVHPRSRANCAIGFLVSSTIRTAPKRNSASYFFRFSDIATPYC